MSYFQLPLQDRYIPEVCLGPNQTSMQMVREENKNSLIFKELSMYKYIKNKDTKVAVLLSYQFIAI